MVLPITWPSLLCMGVILVYTGLYANLFFILLPWGLKLLSHFHITGKYWPTGSKFFSRHIGPKTDENPQQTKVKPGKFFWHTLVYIYFFRMRWSISLCHWEPQWSPEVFLIQTLLFDYALYRWLWQKVFFYLCFEMQRARVNRFIMALAVSVLFVRMLLWVTLIVIDQA